MDISSYGAMPGMSSAVVTTEKAVTWGRDSDLLYGNTRIISSTAVDAGSSPTTELRAGLLLGMITSTGELAQWDPTATDGTELLYGVLLRDISMLNASGVAEDKYGHILIGGPLKAADVLVLGTALTSSAYEHLARKQLFPRFMLDDQLDHRGALYLGSWQREIAKTGDYTVVAADNGTLFTTLGAAGAVNFTLPTLKAGLKFRFLNLVDQNMTITSAAGDDIVALHDLSADSVAFSTASQKIGGCVQVECNKAGTKWYVHNLSAGANTITVAT